MRQGWSASTVHQGSRSRWRRLIVLSSMPLVIPLIAVALAASWVWGATAPTAPPPAAPTPPGATVPSPKPIVFTHKGRVFTVGPDGQGRRALGLPEGDWCAETAGIGSRGPVLSPDGRFIAWLEPDLWVAELASGTRHRITHFAADRKLRGTFCLQLSDWSPDSSALLFHVGERLGLDSDPAPPELQQGFFLMRVNGFKTEALPHLEAYGLWLADSATLLYPRTVNADEAKPGDPDAAMGYPREELCQAALPGDRPTVVFKTADTYALSQMQRVGTDIVYGVRGERIVRAPLTDVARTTTLVACAFAECQSPAFAPGGARLAHTRGDQIEIRTLSQEQPPTTVAGGRSFAWYDETHLLVCRDTGLFLVDVSTTPRDVKLAPAGACFVRISPA